MWTGMKYSEPSSVSVRHWCEPVPGQPSRMLERVGKDHASAVAAWNTREALVQPASDDKAGGEPYGWLYDWTHSSATGKPDEKFTGFTKDEQHARNGVGNENVRAVYTRPQPQVAQPAERVALTDKQVKAAVSASDEYWATSKLFILSIWRLAEVTHNIPGKPLQ